ncbi:tetratricopeptide repeat protein, partial [Nostoc sp.]|uniref:tetratricopeptide repeat protein n=1 Tax=Nostoc sp. TaxID=1180 RepID=UPI002FFD2E90
MTCCLNPVCHNPPNSDRTMFCTNCGTGLVVFRNRYCPIKSLTSGGFGKTYLAEDIDKLNEPCLIKQFAPQVQGTASLNKATELFEQEARRLQQLGKHPQIPTLLAYFNEDNRLYLVQEFIDGQNLLAELQQQGIFNEQKVRELLLDLLDILKTVHQQKVIHRDIKPENIIRRGDGKLVLIDFGASKQLTATVMTQVGTAIGSFGYAPLEQMQGGEAYPASDLYSIGATCFHLLSGIPPWDLWKRQGYGWVSTWRKHLQQPVSQNLGLMLDKLLQEEHQQRYQSAEEVLKALNSQSVYLLELTNPVTIEQKSVDTYYNEGLEKYNNKDFLGAIEDYTQAITINPNYVDAYCNRGLARSELGDQQAAIADYTQAININPNYADAYMKRGYVRFALGDKQAAIEDYTQAIRINPNDAGAYFYRGYVHSELGDQQAAIKDYNQAIKINPNDALAYYNRGFARGRLGDKQAAIEDFTQAIKINPNDALAHFYRGLACDELGDKQTAIANYTQAININPNYTNAYNNRGLARSELGDQQAAIADYTQAIKINPTDAVAYCNRGLARSELGDQQAAIADYTQSININPDFAVAYFYRGLAHYKLGDHQAAIEDYTQAIKINPNDALAYCNRGHARSELGDQQAAIADYTQSININPDFAVAYFYR